MTGSPLHRFQERVHKIHDLEFADSVERLAYAYVSTDVGKAYRQIDTNEWYVLTATTPTFLQLGSGGGGGTFISLTDTPGSYAGEAGSIPIVNLGESALEFIDPSSLVSTPTLGEVLQAGPLTDGYNIIVDPGTEIIGLSGASVNLNLTEHHQQSGTDPVGIHGAGDVYYNTSIDEVMRYSGDKNKWLSALSLTVQAGRNGTTNPAVFYRAINGMVLDAGDRGLPVTKGTLISLAMSRTDSDAAILECLVNGVVVATLASSASGLTEGSYNIDIDTGLISFRNQVGGNATSNVQIIAVYKRRP